MTKAYYNEIDPFAAAWLRELIKRDLIADGDVDERSIVDVQPADLAGYTQCHFFAGIGGWSHALRLAGWPDDRPVWTGSCPCQPFSSSGSRQGIADPRDLWPAWYRLLAECRPDVVFGEQVTGAIGHGWLDRTCDDLEESGYAVGSVVLPASSVGAFHRRLRLYFVADSDRIRPPWVGRQGQAGTTEHGGSVGDPNGRRLRKFWEPEHDHQQGTQGAQFDRPSARGFWHGATPARCGDGKTRWTEPSIQPLADGIPARVGRLRGYGNAIVPQVAAEVIAAYMDVTINLGKEP